MFCRNSVWKMNRKCKIEIVNELKQEISFPFNLENEFEKCLRFQYIYIEIASIFQMKC